MTSLRSFTLALSLTLLAGCGPDNTRPTPALPVATPAPVPQPVKVRLGIALGGGAAKGFAHIGVIKMLEANGFKPEVVSGTSAGSVVGALYASGMDAFQMQQHAVSLDEASIRDVSLFSGGVLKGQALQDYVNRTIGQRAFDKMKKPFAAVATQLASGQRTIFVRGNVGQAVRASCSVPGVFEPVKIGDALYVDGGLVSPVPVDAARQLGADFVIAVDISTRVTGKTPENLLGVVNQTITIMGQKLGEQELARADIVIRPRVNDIGPADFEQRARAIVEGEKAALAMLPQLRAKYAQARQAKQAALARRTPVPQSRKPPCEEKGFLGGLFGRDEQVDCEPGR